MKTFKDENGEIRILQDHSVSDLFQQFNDNIWQGVAKEDRASLLQLEFDKMSRDLDQLGDLLQKLKNR